jgi:hypothetical protein
MNKQEVQERIKKSLKIIEKIEGSLTNPDSKEAVISNFKQLTQAFSDLTSFIEGLTDEEWSFARENGGIFEASDNVRCENNEEHEDAAFRLKVEDLAGKEIDSIALCIDCIQDSRWSLSGDRKNLECD